MDELTAGDLLMLATNTLLTDAKGLKPNDRTPTDRHFAVFITDLEKLVAYAAIYIAPLEVLE